MNTSLKELAEFIEGYESIAPTFLRDLIACSAMKALIARTSWPMVNLKTKENIGPRPFDAMAANDRSRRAVAQTAYLYADAMLAARKLSPAELLRLPVDETPKGGAA